MNAVKNTGNRLRPVRFENLFDEVFNFAPWHSRETFAPMAAWEDGDRLVIELDVPGVAEGDIDLVVNDGKLYVGWERRGPGAEQAAAGNEGAGQSEEGAQAVTTEAAPTMRRYAFDERRYGKFQRIVSLPKSVDHENVEAELKHGLLQITFRKKPELLPRKISVKTS